MPLNTRQTAMFKSTLQAPVCILSCPCLVFTWSLKDSCLGPHYILGILPRTLHQFGQCGNQCQISISRTLVPHNPEPHECPHVSASGSVYSTLNLSFTLYLFFSESPSQQLKLLLNQLQRSGRPWGHTDQIRPYYKLSPWTGDKFP